MALEEQDTRGPENFAEAVGVVSTGERYDDVESPILFDFADELVNRFPSILLHHIANEMGVIVTISERKS